MKASKFTDAQKTFIVKQGNEGTITSSIASRHQTKIMPPHDERLDTKFDSCSKRSQFRLVNCPNA